MTEQALIDANNSIANNLSLQAATRHLTEFDGRNRPLKDFIQDIESGGDLIPENLKPNYVNFVLSRLRGLARDCFVGKKPTTIQEIVDILLDHFAPGKSYASYIREIQSIRIHRDETVSEFYTRLLTLLDLAKAALKSKYKERSAALEPQLEDIALSAFKEGVSDKMSYALIILDNLDTLEKAYHKAKCIESAQKGNTQNPLTPPNSHIYAVNSKSNEIADVSHFPSPNSPVRMDFHSNQNYDRNYLRFNIPSNNSNFNNFDRGNSSRDRTPSPRRYDNQNSLVPRGIMKPPSSDPHENSSSNQNFPFHYNPYPNFSPYYPPFNPYFMPQVPFFPPQTSHQGYFPPFPMMPNFYPNPMQFYNNPNNWNYNRNSRSSSPNPNQPNSSNVAQDSQPLNSKVTPQTDAMRSTASSSRPTQVTFKEPKDMSNVPKSDRRQ